MTESETIFQIPINKLLDYYNALNAICTNYEKELQPLFNTSVPSEVEKFSHINNEYRKSKRYKDIILNVMKEKCYYEIDLHKKEH